MQRLRLKADGRIVELRDGQEFPLAPVMAAVPSAIASIVSVAADVADAARRTRSPPARLPDAVGIRKPAGRSRRDHPQLGARQAYAARTGPGIACGDCARAGRGVFGARQTLIAKLRDQLPIACQALEANCRRQVTITTAAVVANNTQGLTNQPR